MPTTHKISRESQLLLGVLGVPLLWELAAVADKGPRTLPFFACSAAIAVVTWFTRRTPLAGAVISAGLVAVSALLMPVLNYFASYPRLAYLPVTQLVAVMVLIVLLLRRASPVRAAAGAGALTIAVSGAAIVGYVAAHAARAIFITSPSMTGGVAVLALGLATAAGLYVRRVPITA